MAKKDTGELAVNLGKCRGLVDNLGLLSKRPDDPPCVFQIRTIFGFH